MGVGRIQIDCDIPFQMLHLLWQLTAPCISFHRKMLKVVLDQKYVFYVFGIVYHRWMGTEIWMEQSSGYSKWLVLQGNFYFAEFVILSKGTKL